MNYTRIYNGLERIGKEVITACFIMQSQNFFEGLSKTMKSFSQDSHCSAQDLEMGCRNYKKELLLNMVLLTCSGYTHSKTPTFLSFSVL